ncbi:MAG: hypothetical protein C0402_07750 [Thermodesulfovibrio sp.]|nr:hypothetical protein [Thermodesulfovibrio sp.]
MKRNAGLVVRLLVLFLLGLAISGCSKKQETSAPADKPMASQAVNMQDGKWEITNTLEMQGMPAGMMKPQTFFSCLSQKDYVPKGADQKDCEMKSMKVDGNTVNWEMACKDSSGKGKITYAGNSFDGVMEMMMKDGGKEMNAKMTMKGKHIGPCDK